MPYMVIHRHADGEAGHGQVYSRADGERPGRHGGVPGVPARPAPDVERARRGLPGR